MNRIRKTFISLVAALLVLVAVGFSVLSFGNTLIDHSGWRTGEDGALRYMDEYGDPLTGWQVLNGGTYYLDPAQDGAMVTGWLTLDADRYYLGSDGTKLTGWLELESGRYYLDEQGRLVTGWADFETGRCYFDKTGCLQTGWLELEGKQYYLDPQGIMQTGWLDTDQGRRYLDESGTLVLGWTEVDGNRYYLGDTGYVYMGWLETEEGSYYLDDHGIMVTGWLAQDNGTYYLDDSGIMRRGWLELDTGRYYLREDGTRATGWLELASGRYYLDETGRVQTGWMDIGADRCYLKPDGTMAVGQVMIDGETHFFTSQGKRVLIVNGDHPVPDDYPLNLVEYQGQQIDAGIRDALDQLLKDCQAAGFEYSLNYGYRSEEDQQKVWDERIAECLEEGMTEEEALKAASEGVAQVGHSEHHTGLAADVGGTAEMYQWLAENCWKYGFIIRYPEGAQEYTGVTYEPWHIRYVGLELAREIYELDVCLEVYFNNLTK